jgi:hypothetical protein
MKDEKPKVVRVSYEGPGICREVDDALIAAMEGLGYESPDTGYGFGTRDLEFFVPGAYDDEPHIYPSEFNEGVELVFRIHVREGGVDAKASANARRVGGLVSERFATKRNPFSVAAFLLMNFDVGLETLLEMSDSEFQGK